MNMTTQISVTESHFAAGKVYIPAAIREVFAERGLLNIHMTRGMNGCLFLFSDSHWKKEERKFSEMFKDRSDLVKLFFRNEGQHTFSITGDFTAIPEMHAKYADLKETVVWVVLSDRVEMWAKASWAHS